MAISRSSCIAWSRRVSSRTRLALGHRQLADREAHREVHQIERPGAQILRLPRHAVVLRARAGGEIAVDQDVRIAAAGDLRHISRRHAPEFGRKTALQFGVGLPEGVDGKLDRVVLGLDLIVAVLHLLQIARKHQRIAQHGQAAVERGDVRGDALGGLARGGKLPAEPGGLAVPVREIQRRDRFLLQLVEVRTGLLVKLAAVKLLLFRLGDGEEQGLVILPAAAYVLGASRAVFLQQLQSSAAGSLRIAAGRDIAERQHDAGHQTEDGGDDQPELHPKSVERGADDRQQEEQHGRPKRLCVPALLNTDGGPRRSANAEILDPNGDPIPNLYSAGEFGSIWGHFYEGSGNIAECLVFGRIAARNILAK